MYVTILGHILAIGIGISLGLMGGGGSILAVPILVYVMGIDSSRAVAMSLFIVGSVSLLGVIPYARQALVKWRVVAEFTPAAMIGAYLGTQLLKFPWITETVQLASFGIVMLIASGLMIRKGVEHPQQASLSSPSKRVLQWFPLWLMSALQGFGVGIITGFVGVGGGFLIIPALVLLNHMPIKMAVGTSLSIITLNSAAGLLGYLNQVSIDWKLTLSFTLAAGLGTVLGSWLSQFVEASQLQKGFGYFVLAIAIFVLVQR